MSEYVKLTLAASTAAVRHAGLDAAQGLGVSCSAILGTTHGSTGFCEQYYGRIVAEGVDAANPLLFAEGVPNAAAAHLSTMLSIKGFCQSVIGTRTAGLEAVTLAAHRIRSGLWDRAIVGAADEYSTVVNRAYGHQGLYGGQRGRNGRGFVAGCGAVSFVLESRAAAQQRGASSYGAVDRTAGGAWPDTAPRSAVSGTRSAYQGIGAPEHILASGNRTWIDRVEFAGLRASCSERRIRDSMASPVVSTAYGHLAECFSVGPLAALAGVLLTRRMPPCLVATPRHVRPACGEEMPDILGVLGTDYAGASIGVSVRLKHCVS